MNDNSSLFEYCRNKKTDQLIKFIESNPKFDYNIKDQSGTYFILYVVNMNDSDVLKKLLKTNVRIDIFDTNNETILYTPIKFGFIDIIKLLVEHSNKTVGVPITSMVNIYGDTPLHYAIMFKNITVIKLLSPISNTNTKNLKGNTPLHYAVDTDMIEIVKLIINNNNTNITNETGETPLHSACKKTSGKIVELLLSNNANPNFQEYNYQRTPVHYACMYGNQKIIQKLIKYKCDLNIQDFDGNTPIHLCIKYDKFDLVKIILESDTKINLNLFNSFLEIPLHNVFTYASNNAETYINYLLKNTDINFQNFAGDTCLHLLCHSDFWKNFKDILVHKKMDIFISNNDNKRPIDLIKENDLHEFINLCVDSYLNILITKNKKWSLEWENECRKNIGLCREEITKKIKKLFSSNEYSCYNKSYPVATTTKKCIDLHLAPYISISTLSGVPLDVLSGLIYVTKKHSNMAHTINKLVLDANKLDIIRFDAKNGVQINDTFFNAQTESFIMWYNDSLYVDKELKDLLQEHIANQKIRFIIFYLGIVRKNDVGHANILIYDKNNNELERFDPFSSVHAHPSISNIDKKLKTYFSQQIQNVVYVSPSDYMTSVGLQRIDVEEQNNEYIGDPIGYCVAWSLWYADMRATYEIPRNKLIKYIIQQISVRHEKYRSVIRNYSKNIIDIRDGILQKAKLNINQFLTSDFSSKEENIIIDEINKLL